MSEEILKQCLEMALFRKRDRTCRPMGDDAFIEKQEQLLDQKLKPQKPGPEAEDN
ncbi:MAG: hypothetical protein PVH87_26705 [Desulfobacteraceae bacterium]